MKLKDSRGICSVQLLFSKSHSLNYFCKYFGNHTINQRTKDINLLTAYKCKVSICTQSSQQLIGQMGQKIQARKRRKTIPHMNSPESARAVAPCARAHRHERTDSASQPCARSLPPFAPSSLLCARTSPQCARQSPTNTSASPPCAPWSQPCARFPTRFESSSILYERCPRPRAWRIFACAFLH